MLTIITVVKDDVDGLESTLRSTKGLRAQSRVGQIVVDSSAEPLREKIQSLTLRESNVDYLWQPPSGISAAFNLGLSAAKSDWVWFLNSRDEMHPSVDPLIFLNILSSSKAEVIIFELEFMQSRTRYVHPPMWALWPPVLFWVPHPATVVKRHLFEKYGRFKEEFRIAMDGEMWYRLFSQNVVVDMLSIPLTMYDEGGLSRRQKTETAKEGMKIIRRYLPMMVRMWINNGKSICTAFKEFYKASRTR
jgi:hypothetical protein